MAVSIYTKRVTKPFMASVADIRTYVYGAAYDSWNRVQTMTYLTVKWWLITTMLPDRLSV